MLSRYGSIRGASSFRPDAPKLYIDGVEAANPQLLLRFDPVTIERVELARGPQSTALFGADALAGVTSVTTRTTVDESAARLQVRSGMGITGSSYAHAAALEQSHGVTAAFGGPARSARVAVAVSTLGAYVPDAGERSLSLVGSARRANGRLSATVTGRFNSDRTGLPSSPLLEQGAAPHTVSVAQYTAGVTLAFAPAAPWHHTLVMGANGYDIEGAPALADARTAADSALAAAGTAARRTTLRFTTSTRRSFGADAPARITLEGEHSRLDQHAVSDVRLRGTTGASARFDVAVRERLHVSGGLRAEYTTLENLQPVSAVLPSAGASWIAVPGYVSLALRAAWGRGVRWPQVDVHTQHFRSPAEVQSGYEAGLDIAAGTGFVLGITHFAQLAEGLTLTSPGSVAVATNGAIDNRGWELVAAANRGALALHAALAFADSRVRDLGADYLGDLQAGDRVPGVPARTLGIGASWTQARWFASALVTRVEDWMEYDRLALADAGPVPVAELRDYHLRYRGVTRLRAAVERDLGAGFTLQLIGDNLLDVQRGEPDNLTIVPGRSLAFAVRTVF